MCQCLMIELTKTVLFKTQFHKEIFVNRHLQSIFDLTLGPTHETEQHLLTFVALICSLRSKKILELGVRNGGSNLGLLVGASIIGGHVTSVDIQDYGYRPPSDLIDNWSFVVQDALQFLENNTEKYDLILVDDLHTTEHVYKELKYIEKFADKNTMILMHDLMHSWRHPNYNTDTYNHGEFAGTGPHGALMKFLEEHPDFEYATIPVSHGLTLVRRK